MKNFTLSAVNLSCSPFAWNENLKAHVRWLERHGGEGTLLFPELSLSGYSRNKAEWLENKKNCSAALKEIAQVSRNYSNCLIGIGAPSYSEKMENEVRIAHYYLKNGKILHKHEKRILGPSETECFGQGSQAELFTGAPLASGVEGSVGTQICAESHSPALSAYYADSGAALLLMPFASPGETAPEKLKRLKLFLPARAYDNGCFLACCNQIRTSPRKGKAPGAALIIGPRGEILAEASGPEESACSAVINLDRLEEIRSSVMGHFRSWPGMKYSP